MRRYQIIGLALIMISPAACKTGSGLVGQTCADKSDCASGYCLADIYRGESTGWVGGYCSELCTDASDCPQGSGCHQLETGNSLCLSFCRTDRDCRENYLCDPEWKVCLPDCRQGWDCGSRRECLSNGHCGMKADPNEWPERVIGAACELHVDCASGLCIPERDETAETTGWTDGYCSGLCRMDGDCADGAFCYPLHASGYCVARCDEQTSCRTGYLCNPLQQVCLPNCLWGWDCGDELVCHDSGHCGLPGLDPDELYATEIGGPCEDNADCRPGQVCC